MIRNKSHCVRFIVSFVCWQDIKILLLIQQTIYIGRAEEVSGFAMVASLSAVDVVTVVASFVAVFGIAIWGSAKKVSGASGAADFFLAGRNMPWWIIGGSLFASNIGACCG